MSMYYNEKGLVFMASWTIQECVLTATNKRFGASRKYSEIFHPIRTIDIAIVMRCSNENK